jgi:hypothetical protein
VTQAKKDDNRAQILVTRLITVTLGCTPIFKFFYLQSSIRAEVATGISAVFLVEFIAEILIPLLAGCLAFRVRLSGLRWLNGAIVAGHAVAVIVSLLWGNETGGPIEQQWLLRSSPAVVAAVICFGLSVPTFLAALAVMFVLELPQSGDVRTVDSIRLSSAIQLLVSSCVFGALTIIAVSNSRRLDVVSLAAAASREVASLKRARALAGKRAARVTHDHILNTLIFGMTTSASMRRVVAGQATVALAQISALATVNPSPENREVSQLWSELENIVVGMDSGVSIVKPTLSHGDIPEGVAEALLHSATQALANSLAHAGGPGTVVKRVITMENLADSVSVHIEDDGVGFDPGRVPDSRMGIRSSIVARMAGVPGGFSRIHSREGDGTSVILSWRRLAPREVNKSHNLDDPDDFESQTSHILARFDPQIRNLAWTVFAIFLVAQVSLYLLSRTNTAGGGDSILALVALCSAVVFIAVAKFQATVFSVGAALLGVFVAGTVMLQTSPSFFAVTDGLWFLPGCIFLLMWALREKYWWLAWAGMGVLVALACAAATINGSELGVVSTVLERPLGRLFVGTVAVLGIYARQRRLTAERRAVSTNQAEAAFNEALSFHQKFEAIRLSAIAEPLLKTLASDRELTQAEALECVALEGMLRDELLGGRLLQPDLVSAAARARRRGVEVLFLDNEDRRELSAQNVDRIVAWMTGHLEQTTSGNFVGRITPEGSVDAATVVVESSSTSLQQGMATNTGSKTETKNVEELGASRFFRAGFSL